MLTNESITIYHRVKKRNEAYVKVEYENVWWYGNKNVSLNKGLVEANDVTVRIPYNQNEIDIEKIKDGDFLVQGTGFSDITAPSDLKEYYVINSVTNNTVGSEPHVRIGAK